MALAFYTFKKDINMNVYHSGMENTTTLEMKHFNNASVMTTFFIASKSKKTPKLIEKIKKRRIKYED